MIIRKLLVGVFTASIIILAGHSALAQQAPAAGAAPAGAAPPKNLPTQSKAQAAKAGAKKAGAKATDKNAKTTGGAADQNTTQSKAPDAKLIDQSILKANELEKLISAKVSKLVETHVPDPLLSRVSVSVSMDRYELPQPAAGKEDPNAKKGPQRPDAPVAEGSMFDIQRIIDHYSTEIDSMRQQARPIEVSIKHDRESTFDGRAFYEVSGLRILVSLDEKQVKKETRDAIEADTRAAFEPIFGKRLDLKVQPASLYPSFGDRFFEKAQKLQAALIALLAALATLMFLLMNKLIPSWQAKKPKLTDIAETKKVDAINEKKKTPKDGEEGAAEDEEGAPGTTVVAQAYPELSNEEQAMLAEIETMERQIALFAKNRPGVVKALVQEYLAIDGGLGKMALTIEMLARHGVNMDRIEVRGEVLRQIKDFRATMKKFTIEERLTILREVYWGFIMTSFVGEELAISPFMFMESVSDDGVVELLNNETAEVQAAVLTGLEDKRSARILMKFEPARREEVMGIIVGGGTLPGAELQKSIDRLQRGATDYLKKHDRRIEATEHGVAALAPILRKMDFTAEFSTVLGLMNIESSLRESLESVYFNVGLLPDARPEFLARIFVDRDPEWLEAVLNNFDQEFRDRIMMILPPMQQEMLADSSGQMVSRARAMAVLKELNETILKQIDSKELHYGEIFPMGEDRMGGGEGGGLAAAA